MYLHFANLEKPPEDLYNSSCFYLQDIGNVDLAMSQTCILCMHKQSVPDCVCYSNRCWCIRDRIQIAGIYFTYEASIKMIAVDVEPWSVVGTPGERSQVKFIVLRHVIQN